MWQEQPARILCIYSGVAGGGTACAQTHHLDHKTGRLFPLQTKTVLLVSLPACQPISIRCAVWDGGTDEPSELAATSLNTAPCYLKQLCIKHTPTTWLRKATHLHVLSVKKIKEALTTRQWQPPRTMAPEGCLFGALSPNSSSTASLASQIRRVFTVTKLPSLPATLRELWYRVLVSGFVMGKHKTKEDARFCGHCERTCRTRSGRHYEDITHAFALCPLAASIWALALSWWSRRTGETLVSSPSNLVRVAILGFRDPASPPPPGSVLLKTRPLSLTFRSPGISSDAAC